LGLNVRIAPSLSGKLDQANQWFNSPRQNPIGEQAARAIVAYGQKLVNESVDHKLKESLTDNLFECENMINEFVKHEFPVQMSVHLNEKFNSSAFKISRAIAEQAVGAFLDPNSNIQKIYQLIKSSQSKILSVFFMKRSFLI